MPSEVIFVFEVQGANLDSEDFQAPVFRSRLVVTTPRQDFKDFDGGPPNHPINLCE